eukprot:CAMPEP_0198258574 /NCGR_PEP_ID=MMETSP1447-20131203/7959_1 /TAXON_ID=420782 /ORGANISM="Chaetoceros dichaeta, Strain CCMP1751" /LENGTH=65 /DNA_ID=CAMNT_0043945719 /DNA_START=36 /DNA_END=233 /DNA_ORIENTATION=-
MPYQTAPPLIIIFAAFNAASGLMWGVQRLCIGEDKKIQQDEWSFAMDNRDKKIEELRKMLKAADE